MRCERRHLQAQVIWGALGGKVLSLVNSSDLSCNEADSVLSMSLAALEVSGA